jgi:hypothetical protein
MVPPAAQFPASGVLANDFPGSAPGGIGRILGARETVVHVPDRFSQHTVDLCAIVANL